MTNGIPTERIVTLLLNTAQLEYKLKSTLNGIMETKEARWGECRTQVVDRLTELSKYFTGQMVSDFFFPPSILLIFSSFCGASAFIQSIQKKKHKYIYC